MHGCSANCIMSTYQKSVDLNALLSFLTFAQCDHATYIKTLENKSFEWRNMDSKHVCVLACVCL